MRPRPSGRIVLDGQTGSYSTARQLQRQQIRQFLPPLRTAQIHD